MDARASTIARMLDAVSQFSRYRALLSHLGRETRAMVRDAPSAASEANSLLVALPAAEALMDEPTEPTDLTTALDALTEGPRRWVTLTGQSRPVYRPLALHLALRGLTVRRTAFADGVWAGVRDRVSAWLDALKPIASETPKRDMVSMALWESLCRLEAAELVGDDAQREAAVACVERTLAAMPRDGALHGRSADDQLDHWTYRELSGLHALTHLAWRTGRGAWWDAVQRVARFHVEHTQPDYTTYEPWAVHAFLRWPAMAVFADQQLHDMQTNLHVSGPGAALLPALLLADAAGALADPAFAAVG